MLAKQEYEKVWGRSDCWSELYGYHNLVIQSENYNICFKSVVDKEGCYPDEEYCGVYVDVNKDTNVCFFELKEEINPIIKNSLFVERFTNMIEDLYNEKATITVNDIENILVIISNNRKEKEKSLKKER